MLHAGALMCPDVGYCQGQGFVAAAILLYVPEECALHVMRQLLLAEKWRMVDLWRPGMPLLIQLSSVFESLLQVG